MGSEITNGRGWIYDEENGVGRYCAGPNPTLPPQNTLDLYHRAVHEPGSLTQEEKRLVLEYKLPDDADPLCRARCGIALEDLLSKAIEQPDTLTAAEAEFILNGRLMNRESNKEIIENGLGQPDDIRELT